ncbi:MFS transporter [Halobacteriales archaeon SW_7_68_16]|nr:MAG: MFS transporter [Halobacteriales archaeon SW_7_68_16]
MTSPYTDREFVALAATAFARSQAYSTVLIALALYADLFETTGTIEGLFGTAFAVAQLLVIVPLGRVIDLGNAKRYLIAGLLLNVAVFVGFSLVGSVGDVLVVRVVQGLGASLLWLTGSAVVGEISPDGGRGRWLGAFNQVGAFSSLAGDIVGGALLYLYGFQLTYAVLIVVTLAATAAVVVALRDDPGGRADPEETTGLETLQSLLGRSAIRALVGFRVAFSMGKMAVVVFVPIYARTRFGIPAIAIGGLLAGGKLTKTATQGYVGGLTDRVGNRRYFVIAGALVYAVGTACIPLAELAHTVLPAVEVAAFGTVERLPPAFFALFVAYGILGIGDSIRLPASMDLFVEEGEHFDAVAGSLSVRSAAWKVGQVTGPVFVGALWDATSVYTAFLTAAGLLVVATGWFVASFAVDPAPAETTPGD